MSDPNKRLELAGDETGRELAAPFCSAFERAKHNDVTVAMMLRNKCGPEEIIGALAADKERYMKRIMELESIAPRKVVLPDGKIMLWQCPAELVPPCMPNGESSDRPSNKEKA